MLNSSASLLGWLVGRRSGLATRRRTRRQAFSCPAGPVATPGIDQHVDRVTLLGEGQGDVGQFVLALLQLPVEIVTVLIGKAADAERPRLELGTVTLDKIVGFLTGQDCPWYGRAGIDDGGRVTSMPGPGY